MGRWIRFEKIAFLPFRIAIVLIGFISILYFLLFLFLKSPTGIDFVRHKIRDIVHNTTGLNIDLESIRLDIFTAELRMKEFELRDNQGKTVVNLKGLNASLSIPYLLFQKVVISEISIDGISSSIEIKDGKIVGFSDLFKKVKKAESADSEKETSLPDISIEKFMISNMNIDLVYEDLISGSLNLKELSGSYLSKSLDSNLINLNAKIRVKEDIYDINVNAGIGYVADTLLLKDFVLILNNKKFFIASGEIRNIGDPEFGVNVEMNIPLSYLKNYPVRMEHAEGNVALKCGVKGKITSPVATCSILGEGVNIEQFRLGGFSGDVVYDNGDIQLSNFKIDNYGNRLTVNASGGIKDQIKFIGNLKIDDLELAELLKNLGVNSIVMLGIKGIVDFTFYIDEKDGFIVDAKPVLSIEGPRVFSDYFFLPNRGEPIFNLKSAKLSGDVSISEKGISLKNVDVETALSSVRVRNSFIGFSNGGYMNLKAVSDNLDFSDITPIAGLDIRGISQLSAVLKGPFDSLKITGNLNAKGFMFENFYGGSVNVSVEFFNNHLSFKNISGRVNDMSYLGDVIVNMNGAPDIEVNAIIKEAKVKNIVSILPPSLKITGIKGGTLSLNLNLKGPINNLSGKVESVLSDIDIQNEKISRIEGLLLLENGDLFLDRFFVKLYEGIIDSKGSLKKNQEINLELNIKGIKVEESEFIKSLPVKLSGIFGGSLKLSGSLNNPIASFSGRLEGTKVLINNLGNINIDGSLQGRQYKISATLEDKRILFSMENDEKRWELYNIKAFVKGIDVLKFFVEDYDISTVEDIDIDLNGDMKKGNLRGVVSLKSMSADIYDVRLMLVNPVILSLSDGHIEYSDIHISGDDIDLKVNASQFDSESLNISGRALFPLAMLKGLTKNAVSASGSLEADFNIQGSIENPEVNINGAVSKSLIRLSFFPHPFENANLRFFMQNDMIVVDEFRGNLAGGTFSGGGEIKLESYVPQNFNIKVDISRSFISFPRELPSVVTGFITINGDLNRLLVGGEIDIEKATYSKNIDFNMLLLELTKKRPKFSAYSKENEFVFLDIGLRAPSGIVVKNNLVSDSEFKADLRLVGSNERIGIIGMVNALKGKMILSGNEYVLKRGILQFTEKYRIAYNLDFVLSTVCHDTNSGLDHNIDMYISGSDENIVIHYKDNSSPPFSETDIVTCLALGSTPQKISSQDKGSQDESFGIITSVVGVDQKLKDIIPIPIETFRISSKYSDTLRMNVPQVQVSWKLTQNLRLNYSSSIIYSQDQKVELDYKLNRKTSLRTQWNSQAQVPVGNLGVDIKWAWEF